MQAVKFIVREHNKIRKTLARIEKQAHDTTKIRTAKLLCKDLTIHENMEETIWYPFINKTAPLKTTITHLIKEEKKAASTIKKLDKIKDSEKWLEIFTTLKQDVSHHANEEETQLFPKVLTLIDDEDLEKVGKKLQHFKNKHKTYIL
ncbi:MAG: hemerythrin domain-containing protein [Gammaproteobacteria bacterium]|nr:hemerythrin domain-containing protein [Gammaproteobacteria bacterium]